MKFGKKVLFSCRFAIACALVSVGTGLIGVLQTPVILELHGEYRVELVFGMFFTVTGVSGLIAPIFTGRFEDVFTVQSVILSLALETTVKSHYFTEDFMG